MSEFHHHFIKLNSTHFAEAPIILYGIISLEIFLNLMLLIVQPFFCCALVRTSVMHRNFRIQASFVLLYYTIQTYCRFILIYYELNDIPCTNEDQLLFWVETIRNGVHCYFCSIPGAFAFERFAATHYWSWYEKASPSTLWVFVFVELYNTVPAFTGSWLLYTEQVSNKSCLFVFALLALTGLALFLRTYLFNLGTLRQISQGATIHSYSVSWTFQVKENVELMTYMCKLAGSSVMAGFIPFIGISVNFFGPPEWRFVRALAYAIYDLGIVIAAGTCTILAIIGNARIHKEFRKIYPISFVYAYFGLQKQKRIVPLSLTTETEAYFSQLAKAWDQPLTAVSSL